MSNQDKQKYYLLVVEDNAVNQKLAVRLLEKMGYVAEAANNGQEALDILATQQYDLVLMDCEMPVMNGFQASEIIFKQFPCLPIIALTGNGTTEDKAKCLASYMKDMVTKPINFSALDEIIKKWLPPVSVRDTSLTLK